MNDVLEAGFKNSHRSGFNCATKLTCSSLLPDHDGRTWGWTDTPFLEQFEPQNWSAASRSASTASTAKHSLTERLKNAQLTVKEHKWKKRISINNRESPSTAQYHDNDQNYLITYGSHSIVIIKLNDTQGVQK